MTSTIDPTLNGGTTAGNTIQKSELQTAFQAAKTDIEALQAGTGIADEAVTNAKLAHMAADTIKGRSNGSGTGDAEDLTAAQVRTIINVEDGSTADQSDAEIETAYNTQVSQVSAGEKTAGTETSVRRFSPDDVKDMIVTHAGSTYFTADLFTG